jgi:hypothetical protein
MIEIQGEPALQGMHLGETPVRSLGLWIPVLGIFLLAMPSAIHTGAYISMDSPAPKEGMEPSPFPDEPLAGGILLVVLDGVRDDLMTDSEYMPVLNQKRAQGATLEIRTGPLTMTGSCIREMATGVQSRPSEGLNNFHPNHPGTPDGWTLASTHDGDGDGVPDNKVGIIGDYVWRDLYPDRSLIPFSKHYYGHADYYRGDEEAFVTLENWLTDAPPKGGTPNVIVAHLSGPDHVGHRYGTVDSPEYIEKMRATDEHLSDIYDLVPDDWTIIITADHGQTSDGRHGSPDEEIRRVAAIMWGPNITRGVTIEDVKQRDLATLPSTLLSLPMPHAVDGRIPLEAFDVSQSKRDALEQWNWDAAVARNDWLAEEGWPHVEDLSVEQIEWNRLPEDELGVRDSDLLLAAVASLGILALLVIRFRGVGIENRNILIGCGVVALAAIASTVFSYYRSDSSFVSVYYTSGLLGIAVVATVAWLAVLRDRERAVEVDLLVPTMLWIGLCAFVLMYPETRFSVAAYALWAGLILSLRRWWNLSRTETIATLTLLIIMIPALWFTHERSIGFNLTRNLLVFTQPETLEVALLCAAIIGLGAVLAHRMRDEEASLTDLVRIGAAYAILPLFMSLQTDVVDWVVMGALALCALKGAVDTRENGSDRHRLIEFAVLGWLTISWGAWAGVAALLILAATERLIAGSWAEVLQPRENPLQEQGRLVLLILLPLTIWFTVWASLGQVEGLFYPREIDPGLIFLRGGYVGDRISPSNEWVVFMGVGPILSYMFVLWQTFHRVGWPLHLLAAALLVRASLLWLHLSFAADLPRLVFKTTWDAVFALLIVASLIPFVILKFKSESSLTMTSRQTDQHETPVRL